jgi:predicted flavoprotein YhiN
MTMLRVEQDRVILCCGGKKCPKLSKNKEGMIEIVDDFGGKITIKEEQAALIEPALKEVNKLK